MRGDSGYLYGEKGWNMISRKHITFHAASCAARLRGWVQRQGRTLRQSEALIQSGMHPEAINLLEKIIAVEDRNPKARFLLGQAYEGLGSYDQAIHNYKTAINLYVAHPEDKATVRLALAKVYLKQGIRDSGYRELRSIVQSTSDNAVLQQVARLVTDAYQVEQLTSGKKDNYSPRFRRTVRNLRSRRIGWITVRFFIMDIDDRRVRKRVNVHDRSR